MITRSQYMERSNVLHHLYWLEVAQDAAISIGPDLLKACRYNISKDGKAHFNSTPLKSWDDIAHRCQARLGSALKRRGDFWSLSCGACAGKALARHLLEQEGLSAWWYDDTIDWLLVSLERHDDMLGALPPAAREKNGFLLGEESDHVCTGTECPEARFRAFMLCGDKAYEASRPLTVYQFNRQMHHSWPRVDALRGTP